MSVKIVADSTCDLSKELLEKYHIYILPLHVLLEEQDYLDGENITPDEIYAWSDANKATPKTSAPSITEVETLLKTCMDDTCEAVCFSVSGQMSASGNVMRMAAEEMNMEDRIFVVDTLTYLHRGGRCSGLAALAGGALKLHPQIVVEQGKMSPTKKYRGNMSKVIMNYAKDMEARLKNALSDRVFITHSGCDAEIIEEVSDYLKSLNRFSEILVTRAGGVISSHCGPGTLGILFIEQA